MIRGGSLRSKSPNHHHHHGGGGRKDRKGGADSDTVNYNRQSKNTRSASINNNGNSLGLTSSIVGYGPLDKTSDSIDIDQMVMMSNVGDGGLNIDQLDVVSMLSNPLNNNSSIQASLRSLNNCGGDGEDSELKLIQTNNDKNKRNIELSSSSSSSNHYDFHHHIKQKSNIIKSTSSSSSSSVDQDNHIHNSLTPPPFPPFPLTTTITTTFASNSNNNTINNTDTNSVQLIEMACFVDKNRDNISTFLTNNNMNQVQLNQKFSLASPTINKTTKNCNKHKHKHKLSKIKQRKTKKQESSASSESTSTKSRSSSLIKTITTKDNEFNLIPFNIRQQLEQQQVHHDDNRRDNRAHHYHHNNNRKHHHHKKHRHKNSKHNIQIPDGGDNEYDDVNNSGSSGDIILPAITVPKGYDGTLESIKLHTQQQLESSDQYQQSQINHDNNKKKKINDNEIVKICIDSPSEEEL